MAKKPAPPTMAPLSPRTAGQDTPLDKGSSVRQETAKTGDLRPDTMPPGDVLTTNQGVGVGDDQNSLKAGVRGPTLLEDILMREKITHFDHERIPERVVHARGAGRSL
jgi:catalase